MVRDFPSKAMGNNNDAQIFILGNKLKKTTRANTGPK